jgi:hypothetical protein
MELARGDLARILYEASANDADYIFGDSINALTRMKWGWMSLSSIRVRDVSISSLGQTGCIRSSDAWHSEPTLNSSGMLGFTPRRYPCPVATGKAALHPCQGVPLVYFIFWHPEIPEFDYTDLDQHKRILERTFAGIGWRVPEFLDAVRVAHDMYFDSVARVDVAKWARGRIALLGDASSCVSLFGDGSTLAIARAYELAKALKESPTDPQGAFGRYQAIHSKLVASKQKNLISTAARIVPRTPAGLWLSTRLFWRTMGGLGTVVRFGRKLRGKLR